MKNKRQYKVKIEYNEPLKGYISKDEERAEILYGNPDNKNKKWDYERDNEEEIGLEIIEEYKKIPIAEPVQYVEKPEKTRYQSDLKQERRNAVNQARKQQRTVKSVPNVNPQTKMEYINKPKIGLGQNTYIVQPKVQEEFTIGKSENKQSAFRKQKNYDEIAELFYPNMEVKSEITPLRNEIMLPKTETGMYLESQIPTISDAEKLLYPKGTLGEMTPKKLYDLTNYGEQYEKVGNILYPKTDDPKINALKKAAKKENFEIQKERTLTHAKNFGGAALILGTSLVPGVGEARVTVGLAKTLGPIVGKKIAETAAKVIIKGPIQGAVAGLGEGLINDRNLLIATAEGAILGEIVGIGTGLTVGQVEKIISGIKLKNFKPIEAMTKEEKIAFRKYALEYFNSYINGTTVKHNDFGLINLTQKGAKETISKNMEMVKHFPKLKQNIKNSKYTGPSELYKQRKDNYEFHIFEDDKKLIYIIATDENGNRFYLVKNAK